MGSRALSELRHRPRRRALSMTSLIDVIFLLLLFFMLSSTFTRFAELELGSAGQGNAATPEITPVLVQLAVDEITVNARRSRLDDIVADLQQLQAEQVLVSLRGEVAAQRLVDFLVVLSGMPDVAVTVLEPRQ